MAPEWKVCIVTLQFLAENFKFPEKRDPLSVKLLKTHVSFSNIAEVYVPLTENLIEPLTAGISKTSCGEKRLTF
jgi:hypothetical protein